ncbi:hypothetical protein [Streptomyces sp. NPDC127119]
MKLASYAMGPAVRWAVRSRGAEGRGAGPIGGPAAGPTVKRPVPVN